MNRFYPFSVRLVKEFFCCFDPGDHIKGSREKPPSLGLIQAKEGVDAFGESHDGVLRGVYDEQDITFHLGQVTLVVVQEGRIL